MGFGFRSSPAVRAAARAMHALRARFSDDGGAEHVRVLFINGCDLPVLHRYRVEHQREQLELWGIATDEVHYTAAQGADASRADVFVAYRCPITDGVRILIAQAHAQGKQVYFDVDDLVIDTRYTDALPVVQGMGENERTLFDDGVDRMKETLLLCDAAIGSTGCIARELASYVHHTFVNRNVASIAMVERARRARESAGAHDSSEVVLGYFSGSMTHNADFKTIAPALVRVLDACPAVRLKVVGDLVAPEELLLYEDRIIRSERVTWEELPELIASIDVNLAPLEESLFNEAKSENKWLEAALVGIPTVASRFGAFATSICDGETGMLCSSEDEWVEALLRLVDDAELRRVVGESARSAAERYCTTTQTGYNLAHVLGLVPTSITELVPQSEAARQARVRLLLEGRGVAYGASEEAPAPDLFRWGTLSERASWAREAHLSGKQVALLIYERMAGDEPTFRYFGSNVAEHLADSDAWHAEILFVEELGDAGELLAQASVLVLIRCRIRPELLDLASRAKARRVPMVYLIDDDALGREGAEYVVQVMVDRTDTLEGQRYWASFWRGTVARFTMAADLCDALIVPTSFFAHLAEERFSMPAYVVHSSLDSRQLCLANEVVSSRVEARDKRFTVGYFSGTASHQSDFRLIQNLLVSFLRAHDDARLVLGGQLRLDDELYDLVQERRIELMPMVEYGELMRLQAAMDVILAPLEVSEFTNCKSALKIFEAGLVGTPACASPVAAYEEAMRQGETGFVCKDAASWETALEVLCADAKLRRSMGAAARKFALAHYAGGPIRTELEGAFDAVKLTPSRPIPSYVLHVLCGMQVKDWGDPFETSPKFDMPELFERWRMDDEGKRSERQALRRDPEDPHGDHS